MAITNPQAINFSNQVIRPMSESFVLQYYRCKAALAQWYAGKSALFPNDTSVLEDGRTQDTVLTGADITNMLSQIAAYVATIEQSGVLDIIIKPNVRDLGSML